MNAETFSARLSLLLDTWHGKNEEPPTIDEVSRKVGLHLGRVVPPFVIQAALHGTQVPPGDVVDALESVYRAPQLFSDTAEAGELVHRLQTVIAIRDRHTDDGTNVIARGTNIGHRQLEEVLDFIGAAPTRGHRD